MSKTLFFHFFIEISLSNPFTQGLTKYSVVFRVNTFLTAHLLHALHSLRKVYHAGNKQKKQKKQKQTNNA